MSGALDRRSNADNRKSRKPLFGKRIVITRARSQAGQLARRIEELEGEVIYCPAIEIESPESCDALDRAIAVIQTYDWLIFTSVNGVERFLMRLQRLSGSLSKLTGTQIAAIGPQTAARLAREGLKQAIVPKRYLAEGILHVLTPDMMRGKRVLIPRAAKARDILPETLRAWGATVDVVDAYRTVVPDTDIQGNENQETFKFLWDTYAAESTLLRNLNVRLVLDKVEFRTEQNDPLLLLPDHVAGCLHCELGVPDSDLPPALDRDAVTVLAKRLRSSEKISVHRRDFDLVYQQILGNL